MSLNTCNHAVPLPVRCAPSFAPYTTPNSFQSEDERGWCRERHLVQTWLKAKGEDDIKSNHLSICLFFFFFCLDIKEVWTSSKKSCVKPSSHSKGRGWWGEKRREERTTISSEIRVHKYSSCLFRCADIRQFSVAGTYGWCRKEIEFDC